MEKFNSSLIGNTCMIKNDEIMHYHCVIEKQLILELNNKLDIKVGEQISSYKTSNRITRILNYLGCSPKYTYKVINGPSIYENISDGSHSHYEYTIRLICKIYRIFGVKIYIIKYGI